MQHFHILEDLSYADLSTLIEAINATDGWMLALGIVLYASSMLFWILALSRLDVSLAYPLLSASYVIVYVAAVCLPPLHETASLSKLLGTLVMAFGIVIVSLGNTQDRASVNSARSGGPARS